MTTHRLKLGLWSFSVLLIISGALSLALTVALPRADVDEAGASQMPVAAPDESRTIAAVPPRESFEALCWLELRRPLYDPAPIAPVEIQKKVPPLKIKLVGTAVEPDGSLAIFTDSQGKTQFLAVGETLEEATIVSIESDRVTLHYHDQQQVLTTPGSDGELGT